MKHSNNRRSVGRRTTGSLGILAALTPWMVQANPQGLSVQSGSATVSTLGNQLTISASHQAVLNWQSFNIQPGETTRFEQPSASSVVWNRIHDAQPSQIWGNLEANGIVVLMNSSGFYFGPNAYVGAAGLVVSTAMAPAESAAGLFWQFNGAPPQAGIVNHGQLRASPGGSLFLIAERIENHGELSAPGGQVGLLAGQEVLLSSRPDGLGITSSVRLPSGSVNNSGRIVADAGTIALQAEVVNHSGLLQANTVRERNGVIELVAAEAIELQANSRIEASGGETGDAGRVVIKSAGRYRDTDSAVIVVSGGRSGGDGGFVEVSAASMASIRADIDGSAKAGGVGGKLYIDPTDIVIGNTGSGSIGGGSVGQNDPPTTLNLDVNSAFLGFSEIHLQATRNIQLVANTLWDLAASTGVSSPGSRLILEAGNNISLGSGSSLVASPGWSISLWAGRDWSTESGVRSGVGNIQVSGSGSILSHDGTVDLRAGNNVTVGNGFIRSVGGGDISVLAQGGNINTGTRANGFLFRPTGYSVDPDLGGISTAAGGDVTLVAGQDIISFLPLPGGVQTDGGSGAFGAQAGNVTLTAGRDISGHFVVRRGVGILSAGRNAGTESRLLALSLVDGGWEVTAGQNVLLQEVRNPNGVFNNVGFANSATKHLFDYSDSSYTLLSGGNSVQLRGTALPRFEDDFSRSLTPIYPAILEITAGAGGVNLGNDVTLFPSPIGNLKISTTDGGSVTGSKPGDLVQLVVSDSSKKQYRETGDFGLADHAAVPIHLLDPQPIELNISGDLSGVLLGVPKRAEITVGGNLINSRFEGQNLRSSDLTRITVAGDIRNRNEFTSVPLAAVPDWSLLDLAFPPLNGDLAGIIGLLQYDAANKTITFRGRMTGDQQRILSDLPVMVFDANGLPVLAPNGDPATRIVPFLPAEVTQALYQNSQDVPLNPDTGYRLGGGGRFEVSARNLDLGATVGIVSQGPRGNSALANFFNRGADISVNLSGNLDMFSTTISSLNGGSITVLADGDINVGSRFFTGNDSRARGIFTVDPSDVTVIARGDINVNGSRIAAYDGGSVLVRSLEGTVDAGTGGSGVAAVEKIVVDPVTRQILTYAPTIPGSGILATTFPPPLDPAFPASLNPVGNITVEAPRGDIIANAGGVIQMSLNGIGRDGRTVTLRAGTKDAEGNVIHVGSIDATGSGVIGSTVKLEATGNITGVVVARENIDVTAQQSVNVTALAQGSVNVSAGGTISGTIVGIGSVNASGASVDAALLSQNVTASGDVSSSSQVGFSQGSAANAASQSLQADDQGRAVASTSTEQDADELKRGKRELPLLSRSVGRVTVILPKP